MKLKRVRELYEAGEDVAWQEHDLREAEQELRSLVAESMYALGYAMGPVGRVLAVLKDEQSVQRRSRA